MTNLFQIFSDTAKEAPLWPQPFCIYNNPETKCTWLFGLLTVSCREPITYDNSDFVAGTQGGHVCTWWSKTKPYSGDSVVVVRSSGMTYTHPSPFLCVYIYTKSPSIGTFIVLFVMGMSALSYVPTPWEWKDSMKLTCALYSVETSFFAIIRIYLGLSKPLIAGAALHNLFEWSIVLHLMNETKNFTHFIRNMQLASIWIVAVVSIAIMIPNLLLAFLAEQATGIMLDFGMPLMFLSHIFSSTTETEVRQFYRLPAIAHTVHILFTIIPLVMANFFVGTVSWYSSFWNEIAIYISAPVTHLLYIAWSHKVDVLRQHHALTVGETKEDCLLPVQYRFKGAAKFIGIGFIMGVFMLIGVPALIGECSTEPPLCIPTGPITGTSVALINRGYEEIFVDLVEKAKLVESARKFKGNVNYKLVQNAFNPREFRFIETWESFKAVNVWRNSTVPKSLFTSAAMKVTLSGGALTNFGAYQTIQSECTVPATPTIKPLTSATISTTATKK